MNKIISFVMFGSKDFKKSSNFYDAIFKPLEIKKIVTTKNYIGYGHLSDPNDIKFYACLGNHCIYNESGKGHEAQFDYSRLSSDKNGKFVHPYHFYDFGKKDFKG